MVRLAPILLVFALLSGCKGMGGLASGLGHVAGGMAKVAGEMGHVASGMGRAVGGIAHVAGDAGRVVAGVGRVTSSALAHATPVIARTVTTVARNTLPIVEDVAEASLLTVPDPDDPFEQPPADHTSFDGPLIDDHDPCNQCPDDLACDQCIGTNEVACRLTPPDAHARCESSPG